ncbi:MAG: hypothetical protein MHM6MM_004411, partial [Cercozoa sp. M6MM]
MFAIQRAALKRVRQTGKQVFRGDPATFRNQIQNRVRAPLRKILSLKASTPPRALAA